MGVFLNMLGLDHKYNLANWYVYFYIYAMCIMPLIIRMFHNKIWIKLIVASIALGLMSHVINGEHYLARAIRECMSYTPILIMGCVCAKTQILSSLYTRIPNRFYWLVIVLFTIIFRCVVGAIKGIITDIIFVPLFIISISVLFYGKENTIAAKLLTLLGSNSMLMWFIHAIPFSTATKYIIQGSPLWINNVLWIFVVVTILSFFTSIVLKQLFRKLEIIHK